MRLCVRVIGNIMVLKRMKIFNVLFFMAMVFAPVMVHAEYEYCSHFNPAYALCTVHSHNIGAVYENAPANPELADEINTMNEVIGMKTTIIARQIKQQYDTLNAMVKRFKTQLEKAVLTSKMEILTGNTSASNSGGGKSGAASNDGLATAEDCYQVSQENAYDCVARNLTKISQAAEKDITNARKQLEDDFAVMDGYEMCGSSKAGTCKDDTADCIDYDVRNMNRTTIQSCVKNLQLKVRNAKSKFDRENRSGGWGRYQ